MKTLGKLKWQIMESGINNIPWGSEIHENVKEVIPWHDKIPYRKLSEIKIHPKKKYMEWQIQLRKEK